VKPDTKKSENILRSAELTPDAATVVDQIKHKTKIPIKFLIEEAVVNYLPKKYK